MLSLFAIALTGLASSDLTSVKYVGMRIPAILLVPSPQPHLLAFAECGQPHISISENGNNGGFLHNVNSNCDICSKASKDGGNTWSNLAVVVKNSSQPSPVYDTVNKQIVLNFNGAPHCMNIHNKQLGSCGFNMQTSSQDGGVTWGEPSPIDQFLGSKGHAAAGPGVGIELTQGLHKGRLMFIGHRGAYVEDSVWYTDDGGKTYTASQTLLPKMDEAQLVENVNGTIIANMRWTGSPKEGRGVATSTDGGATFSKIVYDAQLKTAVCQATILRSPQNGDVYYAGPAPNGRKDGKVRRSKTGLPGSWSSTSILNVTAGSYGYSCLTDVAEPGKAGLLWEGPGGILFSTFPIDF